MTEEVANEDFTDAFYKNGKESTRTTSLTNKRDAIIKAGWNLEEVPHHESVDGRVLHYGEADNCKLCNRINRRNKEVKQDDKENVKRFEHVTIESLASLIKAWNEVPADRDAVMYMHYTTQDNSGLHMTVFYELATLSKACALYAFGKQLMKERSELKVKILDETDINSHLYPDKTIWNLKVIMPRGIRHVISGFSGRNFIPHMTDHTGKLKPGDVLTLTPELQVIYQLRSLHDPKGCLTYTGIIKNVEESIIQELKQYNDEEVERERSPTQDEGTPTAGEVDRRDDLETGEVEGSTEASSDTITESNG